MCRSTVMHQPCFVCFKPLLHQQSHYIHVNVLFMAYPYGYSWINDIIPNKKNHHFCISRKTLMCFSFWSWWRFPHLLQWLCFCFHNTTIYACLITCSLVITFLTKLNQSKISWQIFKMLFFFASISSHGKSFVTAWCMLRFAIKIVWQKLLLTPSAISWTVNQQFSRTTVCILSTWTLPHSSWDFHSLQPTDVLPD